LVLALLWPTFLIPCSLKHFVPYQNQGPHLHSDLRSHADPGPAALSVLVSAIPQVPLGHSPLTRLYPPAKQPRIRGGAETRQGIGWCKHRRGAERGHQVVLRSGVVPSSNHSSCACRFTCPSLYRHLACGRGRTPSCCMRGRPKAHSHGLQSQLVCSYTPSRCPKHYITNREHKLYR